MPWIDRLIEAHPDAAFSAVQAPEDATIGYDADPRLERAPVAGQRIQEELGQALWSSHETALDHYLVWLGTHV